MDTVGIYAIEHRESGTLYIGQSVRVKHRWAKHRWELRNNKHTNPRLQNAWNKYGEQAFEFKLLEIVDDRDMLTEREQAWIVDSQLVYNHVQVDTSGKRWLLPEEVLDKLRARTVSPEVRQRISKSLKGVPFTDERRANISRGRKGVKTGPPSEEHRRHLSEANKGQDTSKAIKASAAARRGKALSEEHKRKVGEALKGKKRPPRTAEHSEKLRLAALERQARLRAERQHQQADAVE